MFDDGGGSDGGGSGDRYGVREDVRVSDEHIAMFETNRPQKKAARDREASDDRDVLLGSSRRRSTRGTGTGPNVSTATTFG